MAAAAGTPLLEGCDDQDHANVAPPYGQRPPVEARTFDSGSIHVNIVPPYGSAPPPLDASTEDAGDIDANFVEPAPRDATVDGNINLVGDREPDSGTDA